MELIKDFKLPRALRYDDVIDIGDGFAVQLDDREDIKEKQCLIVRERGYDNVIQVKVLPHIDNPTGSGAIDERNRLAQESVIRDVIKELPEFMEQEYKRLEEEDRKKGFDAPGM